MPSIKILIVENELLIAESLSARLKASGYEVTGIAATGASAIELVKDQRPDIVIMDIMLDGPMNGIEAAAQIRKETPVPVIYLTDIDKPDVMDEAMATSPVTYLVKPFGERQIAASIRQALYQADPAPAADEHSQQQAGEPLLLNGALLVRHANNHYKKVMISDLNFIKAEAQYCDIYLSNGDKFRYSLSMNVIHDKIASSDLVRVSRFHVVNINQVTEVKGNLLMLGKEEIQIGSAYREQLVKRLPFLK